MLLKKWFQKNAVEEDEVDLNHFCNFRIFPGSSVTQQATSIIRTCAVSTKKSWQITVDGIITFSVYNIKLNTY